MSDYDIWNVFTRLHQEETCTFGDGITWTRNREIKASGNETKRITAAAVEPQNRDDNESVLFQLLRNPFSILIQAEFNPSALYVWDATDPENELIVRAKRPILINLEYSIHNYEGLTAIGYFQVP